MDKNEIIVISGKGGTGKTTILSSMLAYFDDVIIGDCDVDAPDVKVILERKILHKEEFVGLKKAKLTKDLCINCGRCYDLCKFEAIKKDIEIIDRNCEGCGLCAYVCPVGAIVMEDAVIGDIFISDTKYGTLVDAKLKPGEEASGKLVSKVRKEVKRLAEEKGIRDILVDGSPGIACNVISSITGAEKVVIVTEASESGLHDLKRVHELCGKFKVKIFVVINKYDLSMEMFSKIEDYCSKNEISIDLKIPFDKRIVESLIKREIASVYSKDLFDEIGFEDFIKKIKE